MRDFKKFTSTHVREEVEKHSMSLLDQIDIHEEGGAFKAWMERFHEVYLEDLKHLERKLDYIHTNPLQEKWNLVQKPEDYQYSSASSYEFGIQGKVIVKDYRAFIKVIA